MFKAMQNTIYSLVIPSVTAVVGVSAAHFYYRSMFEKLNSETGQLFDEKDKEVRGLQSQNSDLEHRNKTLSCALEECEKRYGVSQRNLEVSVEEKQMITSQRDEAIANRNTAVENLESCEVEKELASIHLRRSEQEISELHAELERASQNALEMNNECTRLTEEANILEEESHNLKILSANRGDEIDSHLLTIRHLNDYIAEMGDKDVSIQSLREHISTLEATLSQQQSQLLAYEEYLGQTEKRHQAQLDFCLEKIQALLQEREDKSRELKTFLTTHPHLDIDIALTLKADRRQQSAGSGLSSGSSSSFSL